MATHGDLKRRAQQQGRRRMAWRVCGHCGRQAEAMVDWSKQRIPICAVCLDRLHKRLPYWSDWSEQEGLRCPIDHSRPCRDCTGWEDPDRAADRRESAPVLSAPSSGAVIDPVIQQIPNPGVLAGSGWMPIAESRGYTANVPFTRLAKRDLRPSW